VTFQAGDLVIIEIPKGFRVKSPAQEKAISPNTPLLANALYRVPGSVEKFGEEHFLTILVTWLQREEDGCWVTTLHAPTRTMRLATPKEIQAVEEEMGIT
jgi:hypothetical protein